MQKINLKVNQGFYPVEAITSAITDFSEVAKIQYSQWEITIEVQDWDDINTVFNEFMNYVLSVTVELQS